MTQRKIGEGPRPRRRDRLIQDARHDPYRLQRKLPDSTRCPRCGAIYREGRWQWVEDSLGVPGSPCPACQRIEDGQPAGFLSLSGDFLETHRDEILALARNLGEREKASHPLNRIMGVEEGVEGVSITTTDMHLARAIGDAVRSAYAGELDYEYGKGEDTLRLTWRR
jgi:NMD protein affecting ribosome stability and mRNA decay